MVGGRGDPGAHKTPLPLDGELAIRGRVKASAPVVFLRALEALAFDLLCKQDSGVAAGRIPEDQGRLWRLKRSGAWWYEGNSTQMLALRCAKYHGHCR